MFKEFTDAGTGKKMLVQYDHIFTVNESQNAGAQIVSVGGAALATQIPYAEMRAWLEQVDKELAGPDE